MLGNASAEMGKLAGVTKDGCPNLSGKNVGSLNHSLQVWRSMVT